MIKTIEPKTIIMKGIKYLLVSTGRNDFGIWRHTVKNIHEGDKNYGTFYRDIPHSKIKKYL